MSGRTDDSPSQRTGRLRVLVADDDRDNADSLTLLVRFWGHDTHTEYSGTTALAAVGSYRPDVCLLDIGMPGLNGNALAEHIRRTGGPPATLVAITGYADDEHEQLARAAGFQHYLIKPVPPETLQRLLHQLQPARP